MRAGGGGGCQQSYPNFKYENIILKLSVKKKEYHNKDFLNIIIITCWLFGVRDKIF